MWAQSALSSSGVFNTSFVWPFCIRRGHGTSFVNSLAELLGEMAGQVTRSRRPISENPIPNLPPTARVQSRKRHTLSGYFRITLGLVRWLHRGFATARNLSSAASADEEASNPVQRSVSLSAAQFTSNTNLGYRNKRFHPPPIPHKLDILKWPKVFAQYYGIFFKYYITDCLFTAYPLSQKLRNGR